MISAPGLRLSTSFASSISWRSAQLISPSLVTTPRPAPPPAAPVAVAVEGEAELGVGGVQRLDQLDQVLGLRRVRMVVRESAVDLAIKLRDLAAQLAIQLRG